MPHLTALLILAAGGSNRLGQPKQLLGYLGQPLLRHAAQTALAAGCGPVIVVLGAQADACRAALAGLVVQCVGNPRWQEGMGTSIAAGMSAVAALPVDGVLITLCDQPLVTPSHLCALAAAYGHGDDSASTPPPSHALAATAYDGILGVPAAFGRQFFPQLLALTADRGAKDILRQYHGQCAAIPLPAAALDIDTPADARATLAGGVDSAPPAPPSAT